MRLEIIRSDHGYEMNLKLHFYYTLLRNKRAGPKYTTGLRLSELDLLSKRSGLALSLDRCHEY